MPATTTTLIGGNFQDANGNVLANGYLIFKLNQDNSVAGVGNIAAGIEVKILLGSNGSILVSPAQKIWATDVFSTANAFYTVTGYTASGQPSYGPNNQQVTSGGVGGGTFDVGLWVPNSVFSWTPPVQQVSLQTNGVANASQIVENLKAGSNVTLTADGAGGTTIDVSIPAGVTLESNGTPNTSQSLLNLESTDGSVVITNPSDGNVNLQASGLSFGTAGKGFLFPGSFMPYVPSNSQSGTPAIVSGSGVANQLGVVQIILPYAVTIRGISLYVITGGGAGYATTAIYDIAGTTKLVDAGANAFDTHTASQVMRAVSISPVTLKPGMYWWATASTDVAGSVIVYKDDPFMAVAVNSGVVRMGTAANTLSAGAMPASLGAITAFGTSNSPTVPHFLFTV